MVGVVFKHAVAMPKQRRHHAQVRHVTGGEQQCTRALHKFGEFLFQHMMRTTVAGN